VTGWRVGRVLAPPDLTDSIRKVHDFLTVGAATPLQHAGIYALGMSEDYYIELAAGYNQRRNHIVTSLQAVGFQCFQPLGAYYVMEDISNFGFPDDHSFVSYLLAKAQVAAVPGSSFYAHSGGGIRQIRFCFCKKYETLELVQQQLKQLL
jgi:aminotransferase